MEARERERASGSKRERKRVSEIEQESERARGHTQRDSEDFAHAPKHMLLMHPAGFTDKKFYHTCSVGIPAYVQNV